MTIQIGISIGTPPQNFTAIVDLSGHLTEVFSYKEGDKICDNCLDCEKVKCFDRNASKTYVKPEEHSDDPTIFWGIDTVRLGDPELGQLAIKNVEFFQNVRKPSYYNEKTNISAVLGLGMKSDIGPDEIIPILYKAQEESLIKKPLFTIYFNPQGNLSTGFSGGHLTIGGFDGEHCSLDRIDQVVIDRGFYVFKIDGYGLNGYQYPTWKQYVVDLGSLTTKTYVPFELLYQLVNETRATFNWDYEEYQVSCDAKFNMSIVINDKEITIDERVGIMKVPDNDLCFLAINGWRRTGGVDFVLGTNFMKQWCTSYDISGHVIFSKALPS